jgi:hypothetical protein
VRIAAEELDELIVPTRGKQGAVAAQIRPGERMLPATPLGVHMLDDIGQAVDPARSDLRRRAHLTPAIAEGPQIVSIIVLNRLEQSIKPDLVPASSAGACAMRR